MSIRFDRMLSDITKLKDSPPIPCTVTHGDDLELCEISFQGPKNSPYKQGHFRIHVRFSEDYPFSAPHVKFVHRVYHPNVSAQGWVCVDILTKEEKWTAVCNISMILLAIYELLEKPNGDDYLDFDVAEVYQKDRALFEKTAREWTQKYAVPILK